jgi:hypothetical protein
MPMEIIDNINRLFGDDLKKVVQPGCRLKIAASCFSIYAYEALKVELEKIDSLCNPLVFADRSEVEV